METKNIEIPKVNLGINKETSILGEIKNALEGRANCVDQIGSMTAGVKVQKKLAESFGNLLNLTNNDLVSARHLLEEMPFATKLSTRRGFMSVVASGLYRPHPELEYRTSSAFWSEKLKKRDMTISDIQKKYVIKNPKIRLLAFWLDVHIGGLGPGSSNFDNLLEDVYPKSDLDLKTQMITYIKECLYRRKVPKLKYFLVERVVDREMAAGAKKNEPDSTLLEDCREIKRIIEVDRLIEQTRGGQIKIEDLISMLEKSTSLIKYMGDKELEMISDKTKSQNLHERLNKLIKNKGEQVLVR